MIPPPEYSDDLNMMPPPVYGDFGIPPPPMYGDQPKPVEDLIEESFTGFLNMRLEHANLEFHAGPPLERMSPFVIIRMGEFEWKSRQKEDGGHNPEWSDESCELEVIDRHEEMTIEVKDHEGLLENPAIGVWRGPVNFFVEQGEFNDWIELKNDEMPAGRIKFNSSFRRN